MKHYDYPPQLEDRILEAIEQFEDTIHEAFEEHTLAHFHEKGMLGKVVESALVKYKSAPADMHPIEKANVIVLDYDRSYGDVEEQYIRLIDSPTDRGCSNWERNR